MQNELNSLEKIVDYMRRLLAEITMDLDKSTKGNKAASQRVRTGTVKLEKVAKMYRKESILSEKGATKPRGKGRKMPVAKSKAKTPPPKASTAATKARAATAKAPPAKAKAAAPAPAAKGKIKTQKAAVKPKAFAVKRPTAKLPSRSPR